MTAFKTAAFNKRRTKITREGHRGIVSGRIIHRENDTAAQYPAGLRRQKAAA